MVLYLAFQVPGLLVVFAVAAGMLATRLREAPGREAFPRVVAAAVAVLAAGMVCLAFVLTRSAAISAIAHTAYPGHRVTAAGEYSLVRLLYGSLAPVRSACLPAQPAWPPGTSTDRSA